MSDMIVYTGGLTPLLGLAAALLGLGIAGAIGIERHEEARILRKKIRRQ